AIGPVLGIVQRVIAGWLADQAGIDRASAQCGAVTLIQRFGSALNLNIHFHMLWLDGVYVEATELPRRELRLHRARAPTTAQLTQLAAAIAHRVCRHLTRKGWRQQARSHWPGAGHRAARDRRLVGRSSRHRPRQRPVRRG
ncbi:transposase, partial [Escherichia coli]